MPAARHLPQRCAVAWRNSDQAPPSRRYEKSSRSASVYFQRSTPLKAMLTLPSGGASAAFDLRQDGARRVAVGGRIVEAQPAAGAGPHPAAAVLEHLERGVRGQAVGLAVGQPDAVLEAVDARSRRDPDAAVAAPASGCGRRRAPAAARSSGRAPLGEDVASAGQHAVRGRGEQAVDRQLGVAVVGTEALDRRGAGPQHAAADAPSCRTTRCRRRRRAARAASRTRRARSAPAPGDDRGDPRPRSRTAQPSAPGRGRRVRARAATARGRRCGRSRANAPVRGSKAMTTGVPGMSRGHRQPPVGQDGERRRLVGTVWMSCGSGWTRQVSPSSSSSASVAANHRRPCASSTALCTG